MKSYSLLFLVLVNLGCNSESKKYQSPLFRFGDKTFQALELTEAARNEEIADSIEHRKGLEHFLVDVEEFREVDSIALANADWFTVRPLKYVNEKVRLEVDIDLPKTASWRINNQLQREILMQRDSFMFSLNELNEKNAGFIRPKIFSAFSAKLISSYKDSEIISFCFNVSYYAAGTPHGMHMHYSFNFDKRNGNRILFDDLFDITNSEDSLLLIDVIKTSIDRDGIQPDNVDAFDFNILDEYLIFNFDAYEIASYAYGTFRVPLNRAALLKRF